ncbi:MAG: ATP-binding cassette domain-containing protein [Planctomycetes bacterium]|nr:ATP-binding cassette domain-containing protein [Planctomycetota bacterium]
MSSTQDVATQYDLAIHAQGLVKTFHDPERGRVEAVRNLDLDCRYGEIFGLLGPNGAGKTTTLRMLAGILVPSDGRAEIAGVDASEDPIGVRQRIGFLSGSTGLYPRLSGRETLTYFGRLHGMEEAALKARIEELIETFHLSEFVDGRCEGLSTGQRQRISIARAVVHDPSVLILDEPTTGLDIMAASDMIDFVESRRSSGRCVLFSTHILSEAERLCDRIGVVHHGRTLAVGTLEELRELTGMQFLEQIFKELVRRAGSGDEA